VVAILKTVPRGPIFSSGYKGLFKIRSGESAGRDFEHRSGAYVEPDRLRLTRSYALIENVNQSLINEYVKHQSAENHA
jgi:hypothetical protein